MNDTIPYIYVRLDDLQSISSSADCFEKATAIATVIIAIINVILTLYIFLKERKDKETVEDKHSKFEMLRALILDENIGRLYDFYDVITEECEKLLKSDDKATKDEVNNNILSEAKLFRLRFLTLFNVTDSVLYNDLLNICDALVDSITNSIYDEGLKLTNIPKFDQEIRQRISKNRIEMLSRLYRIYNE